jgi:hypothetical protein
MPTNFWLSTVKIALSWLGTRIRGGRLCLTGLWIFRGIVCRITAGLTAVNVTQVFRVCRFLDDHGPWAAHRETAKCYADCESWRSLFRARIRSFVLGTVRTLWVVPRVGTRTAELLEMPIMLVVAIVAARWTVLRLAVPSVPPARLGMGFVALVLMLVAEFGLVLWLRGLSIREYLATRDPVLLTFQMFSVCKDFFHGVYAATAVS